ncbi:MAG: outer membrane beta-barrel domain-containing protein [Deltaproteobacteria bacterium]|nr:outer membrane beta-barrel domain-containing protein [Deltaproteobacteria bacterium]
MTRTLRHLLLLLLLLGLAVPTAYAAPGDAAPDFGDDDDDDDDEEEDSGPTFDEEYEEETENEESEEAVEEDVAEDESDEAAEEEAAEDESTDEEATEDEEADEAAEEDDYDPLEGLNLPPSETEEASEDEDAESDEDERPAREEDDEDEVEEASSSSKRADKAADRRERKKRIVKVIQKKFFLKYRRLELTPHIGYIGNDNFITRLHIGLAATYHINDILGIELMVAGMPNLGDTDYKPLTRRFQAESEVVPDITRVTFSAMLGGAVSPIYGKVELGASRIINYDIYFIAGAGMVHTRDDTAIIRSPCDDLPTVRERNDRSNSVVAENGCWLVDQEHFASYFGGGLRIVFNKWIGIRLDVRNITHIEQAWRNGDVGLEMKQSLVINIGASFFIPPEPRRLN